MIAYFLCRMLEAFGGLMFAVWEAALDAAEPWWEGVP